MAKTDFKSVDDYIAQQPQVMRSVLELVRGAIRKAVPHAEEQLSYKMPAYKLRGNITRSTLRPATSSRRSSMSLQRTR